MNEGGIEIENVKWKMEQWIFIWKKCYEDKECKMKDGMKVENVKWKTDTVNLYRGAGVL